VKDKRHLLLILKSNTNANLSKQILNSKPLHLVCGQGFSFSLIAEYLQDLLTPLGSGLWTAGGIVINSASLLSKAWFSCV
jgi:hypothetical protein